MTADWKHFKQLASWETNNGNKYRVLICVSHIFNHEKIDQYGWQCIQQLDPFMGDWIDIAEIEPSLGIEVI